MATNKYKKYIVSKNMDATGINFVARYGKKREVIGKAKTEKLLKEKMTMAAKRLEDSWLEEARITEEKEVKKIERQQKREAKKLGLWKPGGMVKSKGSTANKTTAVPSKDSTREAIMKAKIKKAAADKAS